MTRRWLKKQWLMVALSLLCFSARSAGAWVPQRLPPGSSHRTLQLYSGQSNNNNKEAEMSDETTWDRLPLLKKIMESSSDAQSPVEISLSGSMNDDDTPATPAQATARLAMCFMISSIIVLHLETLTMQFEAVQAWRYMWPLVGGLYVAAPLVKSNDAWIIPNRGPAAIVSSMAGIGLLVGGYMDAFFPVWYSSPNLLGTCTGLLSDSAAILLIVTIGVASRMKQLNATRGLFLAVLCAQLYEMACGTFYAWGELLHIIPVQVS